MKNALRLIPALCLFCASIASPAFAQRQAQPWASFEKELGLQTSYSVDLVIQTMGQEMKSHIARDGDKTRTEMTMPMMNIKMVMLEIPEGGKSVSYTLFPEKKKYALNEIPDGATDEIVKPVIEELGSETLDGVPCVKRHIVMKSPQMESDMTVLFSPEQKDMPVRMDVTAKIPSGLGRADTPVKTVILFQNYDFSTPNGSLFEIPADYTKADSVSEIMMESMGGMMQNRKAPQP